MASEVSMCSSALGRIGDEPILTLEDDSTRAKLCKRLYPDLRDAVLREHPWNFAVRRMQLGKLATAPAFGWAYQYQLPHDPYCLRVVAMERDEPYVIEGRKLLSDVDPAKIRFIAKITDTGEFDALFTECLTARLAAELAYGLAKDSRLGESLFRIYEYKLASARGADGQEGTLAAFESSQLLEVR